MGIREGQRHALAYVLRLWRVSDGERAIWRASLQDVRSGERVGFAGLDEAMAYLQQQIGAPSEVEHSGREPGSSAP
ncbi:MAG: hypothetical protein JXA09_06775 [Anaerolineae bacterium]|nr:hypothetical protein [Anaerolineae bacterium]